MAALGTDTAAEYVSVIGQGHPMPRPKWVFPNYWASHLWTICFLTHCDNTGDKSMSYIFWIIVFTKRFSVFDGNKWGVHINTLNCMLLSTKMGKKCQYLRAEALSLLGTSSGSYFTCIWPLNFFLGGGVISLKYSSCFTWKNQRLFYFF